MSVDRSTRSTFAALLLIAALFVAMNRIVASAPLGDWGLPLVLFILGAALVPNWNISRSRPEADEEDEALALPGNDVHTYRISAQQVPRLHTMTIRPDPEEADTVVTITEDTPGDVLPFVETEVVESAPPAPAPTPEPSSASPSTAPEPIPSSPPPAATSPAPEPTPTPEPPPATPAAAPEPVPSSPPPAATSPTPEPTPTPAPAATSAASEPVPSTIGSADDLTKLNGIGPKSAAALKAAGIDSFHKLANSSDDQIRAAVAEVRLVGDVTTWARQAAYAAQSDWAGLDQFNTTQRKATNGD